MKIPARQNNASAGVESWCRTVGIRGGDFVMRHETPRVLTTVVADATGHGEDAAQVASFVHKLISRDLDSGEFDPHLLRQWHNIVYRRFQLDNRFVCITLLQLDLETQKLTIINAGNPDVLVRRGNSPFFETFSSTGMPLGLVASAEWKAPKVETTYLRAGDYVMCFTDGVIDCLDATGHRFGLNRVYSAVQSASASSPLSAVRRGLLRFWSPEVEQDDLSILVVHGRSRQVA